MVNKKICIAIPQDLYDFISAQRLIPEEPFHKVIRRLMVLTERENLPSGPVDPKSGI